MFPEFPRRICWFPGMYRWITKNTHTPTTNFCFSRICLSLEFSSKPKPLSPPHQFFQGKGEGAAEDLAANQWTQQMGYQCISYWYVGGWNQQRWPLNHFSARERRFCYNVHVEAWNSCKGSYIEQKKSHESGENKLQAKQPKIWDVCGSHTLDEDDV